MTALSPAVEAEIRDVLTRPKFARRLTEQDRTTILAPIAGAAARVEPKLIVIDCRNGTDNRYLEFAVAVGAAVTISSDSDPLDLRPWRGSHIPCPGEFLGMT